MLLATGEPVSLNGPTTISARYGSAVTISGHAAAGSTVTVWFHAPRTVGYKVLRTLQADGNGVFDLELQAERRHPLLRPGRADASSQPRCSSS